jgi:hypothetical protein
MNTQLDIDDRDELDMRVCGYVAGAFGWARPGSTVVRVLVGDPGGRRSEIVMDLAKAVELWDCPPRPSATTSPASGGGHGDGHEREHPQRHTREPRRGAR